MDPAQALEMSAMARRRVVDEASAAGDSIVQQFYRGAVVFVTGGSGFLGKHLVEKLLRSCDAKRIYLLMRSKKGRSVEERLTNTFQDPLYDSLHKSNPEFLDRVVAVDGDVTQPRLGISDRDWQMLADEVTIIFHAAATISFDEPLRPAILTNVRGTTQALLLGRDCKNIKSFVYISSAYVHVTRKGIGGNDDDGNGGCILEEFYGCAARPDTITELVEQLSEEKLAAIKPKLIEDWPNSYTFSKAIAEEAVRTMAGDLPICIVRPGVVIASMVEPTPGWIDISSTFGPSGIIIGCGIGFIHTFMADDDSYAYLVPVDFVSNATLAAAWETAERRKRGQTDPKIYTVTCSKNPVHFTDASLKLKGSKFFSPRAIWYIFEYHTKYRPLFVLLTWLLHYIPGYLADGALRLLGKKPRVMNLYRTAFKLSSLFAPYTLKKYMIDDTNVRDLYEKLSPEDKTIFNFDTARIDWSEMLSLWIVGVRKYIVKDGLKDTVYAARKQAIFRILNYIVLALYAYVIYKSCESAVAFVGFVKSVM